MSSPEYTHSAERGEAMAVIFEITFVHRPDVLDDVEDYMTDVLHDLDCVEVLGVATVMKPTACIDPRPVA